MTIVSSLDDIIDLYATRGDLHYGEGVTQIEHAVQCATLAETSGASSDLIVASLLHDIGHLLVDSTNFCIDDRHEIAGADALDVLFGESVAQPVALHVSAKRYLCHVEPGYLPALSTASQRSLALQGGSFDRHEAEMFERLPHWRAAVTLRRFDDIGKSEEPSLRTFADFVPLMHRLVVAPSRS